MKVVYYGTYVNEGQMLVHMSFEARVEPKRTQ